MPFIDASQAVLVSNGGDGLIMERLRLAGWTIDTVPVEAADVHVARSRPVLVMLDSRIDDLPGVAK